VQNLVAVSRLRRMAQKAGLSELVTAAGKVRIVGAELPDSIQVRLQRMYPGSRYLAQTRTVMLPLPELPDDAALIAWAAALLAAIYPEPATASAAPNSAG
jgi:transcription-repair coupling factor (superfamily II helicase)